MVFCISHSALKDFRGVCSSTRFFLTVFSVVLGIRHCFSDWVVLNKYCKNSFRPTEGKLLLKGPLSSLLHHHLFADIWFYAATQ